MIVDREKLPKVLTVLNELGIDYQLNNAGLHTNPKILNISESKPTEQPELPLPKTTILIKPKKLSPMAQKMLSFVRNPGDKTDIRTLENLIESAGYSKASTTNGTDELIKNGFFIRIGKGKYIRTAKKNTL